MVRRERATSVPMSADVARRMLVLIAPTSFAVNAARGGASEESSWRLIAPRTARAYRAATAIRPRHHPILRRDWSGLVLRRRRGRRSRRSARRAGIAAEGARGAVSLFSLAGPLGEAGDAGREEPLPPPRRQGLEQAHGHPVEDLRARHAGPVRGEGRELPDVARPDV